MADGNGHVQSALRKSKHPDKCGVCDSTKHGTGWHEAQIAHWAHHDWDEYVDRVRARGKNKDKKTKPGTLLIEVGSLASNTRDAIELLADDPDLYQRAGELVRVVRVTEADASLSDSKKGLGKMLTGTPLIKPVPEANLMTRMSDRVPCEKWKVKKDGAELVACDPPSKLARAILVHAEYPSIRLIRGVAEAPFLRQDGTVCQEPGYDSATGYLYAPSVHFPPVPDRPSQEDARQAFKKLWHVYKGLEFVDDAARACPIAGILTIFAQAAIQGCTPVFMTEANTPGTGKTITVDTIGIITAGRPMPRRSFPGPGEELRKVLDAYALDGTRYFCLDNIGQDFGGESLEAAITTEGHYDLRVLGKTENRRVEWKTIVFGSGNNIGFCRPDIVPRTLMSRMETKVEDPRGRDVSTFLIKEDLKVYARRKRVELAVAALTMLRAFEVAGRPPQDCKPWGSFGAFRDLVIQSIMFAGGPDISPCRLTGEKALSADSESQNLLVVLEKLPELFKQKKAEWMTCQMIIDALYSEYIGSYWAHFDILRTGIEGLTSKKRTGEIRPTAQGLGYTFAHNRKKVLGGAFLDDAIDARSNAKIWRVTRV